jgi:hypothetical protein
MVAIAITRRELTAAELRAAAISSRGLRKMNNPHQNARLTVCV